jgi:hypothetical protein
VVACERARDDVPRTTGLGEAVHQDDVGHRS